MKRAYLGVLLLGILAGCDKQAEPTESTVAAATSSEVVAVPLAGKDLFAVACQACHSIEAGAPHRVGPNLYGVAGQAAASREGFQYSDALTQSGITWTKANLIAWVVAPEALVPGTWMLYHNTLEADEVPRLIEYIEQASGTSQP